MVDDSSSRTRKVRGKKIRTDRDQKRGRRAKKTLARQGGSTGSDERDRNGDTPLSHPDEVVPEPFVETEEIEALRDRICSWLDADQPVHLIGPTGCGKTSLALSAAAARGRPVVWINGDEAVDTAALVGAHSGGERYEEHDRYVSGVDKRTQIVRERWVDNPLSVAVREGATLVYNEFSRSDPVAHNVLLSVFEEGVLERPGKRGDDRTIDVHPEFRAILTSNDVEYAGVHQPQDALLDRVVGVTVDYYDQETEEEIVAAHVDLPRERIERIVSVTRALRDDLDVVVGTRAAITAAKGLAVFDAGRPSPNGDGGASENEASENGELADTESDDGESEDGGSGEGELDDELLVDVFTDVLAPKVAGGVEGTGGDAESVSELRDRIANALKEIHT